MSDSPLPSALPDLSVTDPSVTEPPVTEPVEVDALREPQGAVGPWTPTIHRLLEHLRDRGLDWVAEPLGIEADREILGFVPGDVPNHPMPDYVWSPENLDHAAWMLRNLHDATLDFPRSAAVWRQPGHEPAEVICHNDFARTTSLSRARG